MKKGKNFLIWIICLIFALFLIGKVLAGNSGTNSFTNLTIWDDTDSANSFSDTQTFFYSNYTNATSAVPLSDCSCIIRFQNHTLDYGPFQSMAYNDTSELFSYNQTFSYKGTYLYQVNCSNFTRLLILLEDNFTISNTAPSISVDQGGSYIDIDGNKLNNDYLGCAEDTLCAYNFSTNVTEININDVLTYGYAAANTTLLNFTLNSSTSILEINVTRDENAGDKEIELTVKDTESSTQSGILRVNVSAVNDAPIFQTLENWTFNVSDIFEKTVNITDEEGNVPYVLGITFLECSLAEWSTRADCDLFNSSNYNFNSTSGVLNWSFTPSRNDVGSYIINFSARDNNTLGNKTGSQVVNFTVLNVNTGPNFNYTCNDSRAGVEDSEFTCWINVTDTDETHNLTFTANYSWFKFNDSGTNTLTVNVNQSTNYEASVMINFTPEDPQVGNWSINISVTDTGGLTGPIRKVSDYPIFFMDNVEDNVTLGNISDKIIYENLTFYVNATDDDLLVPDKNEKNEVLTFRSNTSWVQASSYNSAANYTAARIIIDYATGLSLYGPGTYKILINVTDEIGDFDESFFNVSIGNDNRPQWNESMDSEIILFDKNETYLNFSQNVTDQDNDDLTFSYVSSNSFPSLSISSLGIMNITPINQDVGFHNVTINASDGMLDSLKSFNFTVYNVNDLPYLMSFDSGDLINASLESELNVNCTEDNVTSIWLWVQDDDFRIPDAQKVFYNESHTINLTIQGPNPGLFEFYPDPGFITQNLSKYTAYFTPRKADLGRYNITINVTDRSNASYVMRFNLTVGPVEHGPELINLTNQSSSINSAFYYRINATDIEDGNSTDAGNRNFTFSYAFNTLSNIFNQSTFNSTTGEINITFNSTQSGAYHINITVNDSTNLQDSGDLWIYVYGPPSINYPNSSYEFELNENSPSNLTFRANDSIGGNLSYLIYISNLNGTNILRYNLTSYGNNTNISWLFTPNFTDETYGENINLTMVTYPENFSYINSSRVWNLSINHSNAPIEFFNYIDNRENLVYNTEYMLDLEDYFSDIDYSDTNYNQTVNFTIWSNATLHYISWSLSNWTLTFSSSIAISERVTINASDMEGGTELTNVTSNEFEITFIAPETTVVPTSGGGGGGSSTTPLALKIVFPSQIDAYKKDRIEVPISLENNGKTNLYDINLTSFFSKDNKSREDIKMSFSQPKFDSLMVGEKKNTTLTIDVDTEEVGLYEILINASVDTPDYSDWGLLQLTVKEANKTDILEKLLFTEEFIAENPECIEIKEIVNEAWNFYSKGAYEDAMSKAREAIDSCRYAISQPAIPREKETFREKLYKYLSWASLVLLVIVILYYTYNRIRIKRK
jgi:hypothetical protein